MIDAEMSVEKYGTAKDGKLLQISLSDKEQQLISLLRNFVSETKASCTLRIAGGWVRDKLLGLPSDDLDIAVDNMSGIQLATALHEFIKNQHVEEKEHSIAIIQTNPDKSKHLETATTKIFGMHVDFVNLRSETYLAESRIPDKIAFGTPTEDAFRRDISINCLFFNVHSLIVEDFTGFGLDDLKAGIIRTPLEAKTTFLDDPLRILRVIRFASRFGYSIVDEIFEACKCVEVRKALALKVSKERIGTELVKILLGNNPDKAIEYFMRLRIADIIFAPFTDASMIGAINWEYFELTNVYLARLIESRNFFICQNMHLAYLACCLLYFKAKIVPISDKNTSKMEHLASKIVRESLKLSNAFTAEIETIFSNLDVFSAYLQRNSCTWNRRETGKLLRECKINWDVVGVLSCILPNSCSFTDLVDFKTHISDNKLAGCWEWKPLLNGIEISEILKKSPGPYLRPIFDELLEWQFENPSADKVAAAEFIRIHHCI